MPEIQKDRPTTSRYVHPPLVAVAHIAVAYVLGWFLPIPFSVPGIGRMLGFGLTVIGFLLGVAAVIDFRKARTTLDPHGAVSAVITGGIYRFTRNPIYLGFLCMVIGLPLNSGYYWGLVASPIFVLTMNRLVIEKEEAYLKKKFGEPFLAYASRVRRWL